MTFRAREGFRYRGHDYTVWTTSAGTLFEPRTVGICTTKLALRPQRVGEPASRGYVVDFSLSDDGRLMLDSLLANIRSGRNRARKGPAINGIEPTVSHSKGGFTNRYEDLACPLTYTGGVLLVDDAIKELYDPYWPDPPLWVFRDVRELVLEDGILDRAHDHSRKTAELRDRVLALHQVGSDDGLDPEALARWIEQTFDLGYPTVANMKTERMRDTGFDWK